MGKVDVLDAIGILHRPLEKFMWMCSAEFCDNLLVEADVFTIIEVSFYVTRNALNLIEIKKQERKGTVK